MSSQTIGWREWVELPELGIQRIKAKIDTGARTSALHAFSVETYAGEDGAEWVRFGMHPRQDSTELEVYCNAPVVDRRMVRDSGGHQTERVVIATTLVLAGQRLQAEVTLTDRDDMLFRMLLGRTAMRGRFIVDPGRSFLASKGSRSTAKKGSAK